MNETMNIIPISEGFKSVLVEAEKEKDNGILASEYLNTCKGLASIAGKFMKIKLVQKDIEGNVKKIESAMDLYGARTIQEVLLKEHKAGGSTARIGMLWLNRTILFTSRLISGSVESTRPFKETVAEAYNQTLRPYHGKVAAGAVKVAMAFVPKRKKIVKKLLTESGLSQEEDLVPVMRELGENTSRLGTIIEDFYKENGFNTEVKAE